MARNITSKYIVLGKNADGGDDTVCITLDLVWATYIKDALSLGIPDKLFFIEHEVTTIDTTVL